MGARHQGPGLGRARASPGGNVAELSPTPRPRRRPAPAPARVDLHLRGRGWRGEAGVLAAPRLGLRRNGSAAPAAVPAGAERQAPSGFSPLGAGGGAGVRSAGPPGAPVT
ncbi:hypothetical protein NN561_019921 [Cricetulus griseus]